MLDLELRSKLLLNTNVIALLLNLCNISIRLLLFRCCERGDLIWTLSNGTSGSSWLLKHLTHLASRGYVVGLIFVSLGYQVVLIDFSVLL